MKNEGSLELEAVSPILICPYFDAGDVALTALREGRR
jgi:hypothetical protein